MQCASLLLDSSWGCKWVSVKKARKKHSMESSCHSQLANGPLSGLWCFYFSLELIRFFILKSNSFLPLHATHVGIAAPGNWMGRFA